jgi:hypothetical protein
MRRLFEPLSLIVALALAYAWMVLPELRGYSLQLASLGLVLFFVLKRVSRSRLHHILPRPDSLEAAILLGVVSLGIGATGGLASPFLPVYYLLLFITVLTLSLSSNLVALAGMSLFLWGTTPHPLASIQLIELVSLPFLLPLMVFARMQFDEAKEQKYLAEQEEILLDEQEEQVVEFLSSHLHPKLQGLRLALETSPENNWMVRRQLEVLEKDSQELLLKVRRITLEKLKEDSQESTNER